MPKRRTDLLASRLAEKEANLETIHLKLGQSFDAHREAEWAVKDTIALLREWTHEVNGLAADYERENRQPTSYCKLSQAKRKIETYSKRLPRCQKTEAGAKRRLARHESQYMEEKAAVEALQAHYQRLLDDNATNADPVQAIFRLDGGFASLENIYWLIEMGYEVYTRGRSTIVRDTLSNALNPDTEWVRVGGNAELTAWDKTTVNGYFAYPMDVALAHYHTGDSIRRATLLHYGQTEVVADLNAWFHMYNGRQTIEAGIKEGKNVFQMHHLKVRSPQALRLQEHLACFAANFVRFAADWLISLPQPKTIPTESVKEMVQVGAHTSAWVRRQGDVWLLRFTEQSCYAGYFLRFGKGFAQLPLPLFKSIHFSHF